MEEAASDLAVVVITPFATAHNNAGAIGCTS